MTADVETRAYLSMTKTVSPDPVVAGENVTWTLVVANAGPSNAQNVVISDELPANVTFVSAEATAGSCEQVAGVVTCTVDELAAAGSVTITIVAAVAPSFAAGPLANTATVTSDTPDPDSSNDSDTATSTVETSADISITKSVTPDPVVAGEDVMWTITVANAGPSDATEVTVLDALPAGIANTSMSATMGTTAIFEL